MQPVRTPYLARSLHLIIVMVCAVLMAAFIYHHAGGPQQWDDLFYLELALNPEEKTYLLHRYIHILFLKSTVLLTGDALQGAGAYWAIMYAVTVAAVYFGASLLATRNKRLIGLMGVLLFVGLSELSGLAGVPYADFTVMMFVAVASTLYIVWCELRGDYIRGGTVAVLVVVLSVATMFSKETGIVLLIFVLALFGYYLKQVAARPIFRSTPALLGIGSVVAVLAIYLIGMASLGKTLPLMDSSVVALNAARVRYLLSHLGERELMWDSYYTFALQTYPFLFVAYLVGIMKWLNDAGESAKSLSWFIPIGLLVFLTGISAVTEWGIQPRYLFPMLPVLAMWGAQIFQPPVSVAGRPAWTPAGSIKDRSFVIIVLVIMALAAGFAVKPVFEFIAESKWTRDQIYQTIVLPLSVLLLFSIVLAKRYWSKLSLLILVVAAIALLAPRVDTQLWLLRSGAVAAETEERFKWLEILEKHLTVNKNTRLFISENVYDQYQVGGRSDGSSTELVNIYFNINMPQSNVVRSKNMEILVEEGFDVAIVTNEEWRTLDSGGASRLFSKRIASEEIPGVVMLLPE